MKKAENNLVPKSLCVRNTCYGPSCSGRYDKCLAATKGCFKAWEKAIGKDGCGGDQFINPKAKDFKYEGLPDCLKEAKATARTCAKATRSGANDLVITASLIIASSYALF